MLSLKALPILAALTAISANAADCASVQGTLLTGTVTSAPRFVHGHLLKGIELSHTHVGLTGDDGKSYDVALDNVFAAGYDAANPHAQVPAPLSSIKVGNHLQLCGVIYTVPSPGLDWAHTNCGAIPIKGKPNGWTKIVAADGLAGDNLESSQEYCKLWGTN